LEATEELLPVGSIDGAVDVGEEAQRLAAGERRPEVGLAGDVGEAAVDRRRVAPRVEPEDEGPTRRRPDETKEERDGRRLPGPVGAEVAEDLTRLDLEVEAVERDRGPVPLGELLGPDRRRMLRQAIAPSFMRITLNTAPVGSASTANRPGSMSIGPAISA